jgi:hypothetical protein
LKTSEALNMFVRSPNLSGFLWATNAVL